MKVIIFVLVQWLLIGSALKNAAECCENYASYQISTYSEPQVIHQKVKKAL